ncbi:disheveled-associated activator of morphogenesis 2-like [Drosophila serrata]|uniref:disheveled-associated activator of morphogenesis 2-like n=1 Tax=Drosophila serrata TaxID=7274 RepID=UPI000A1D0693|nr:disheveled-associated activator of morphogenesis 2-like [Drosophila serrata]
MAPMRICEQLAASQPSITSVKQAYREVASSRRLRKFLELVLALARGNGSEYRLPSLNRLADTKSSAANVGW